MVESFAIITSHLSVYIHDDVIIIIQSLITLVSEYGLLEDVRIYLMMA